MDSHRQAEKTDCSLPAVNPMPVTPFLLKNLDRIPLARSGIELPDDLSPDLLPQS